MPCHNYHLYPTEAVHQRNKVCCIAVITLRNIKSAVITLRNIKSAVITLRNIKSAVITLRNIKSAVITLRNIKSAVIILRSIKSADQSYTELLMSIPSKRSSKLVVFFCTSKPSNRSINNFRVLILSKSSRIDKNLL